MNNNFYYLINFLEMFVSVGGVCVALPLTITWMVLKSRTKKMNRKMDILMKAVEAGQQVDPALLVSVEEGGGKYKVKKNLLNRLCAGIFLSLGALLFGLAPVIVGLSYDDTNVEFIMTSAVVFSIGVGFLISYFVGRKFLAKEIEAEEKKIEEDRK